MHVTRRFEKTCHEIHERHHGERHNKPARCGQKDGEPAAESRKYGKSDRARREIQPNGDRAFFTAEIFERKKDRENLQRKRNRCGNGYKGADRDQSDRKRDMRHISSLDSFQHVFFHSLILTKPPPQSKRLKAAAQDFFRAAYSKTPSDLTENHPRANFFKFPFFIRNKCLPNLFSCATITKYPSGQLAQLVERLLDVERVRGSSPLLSTIRE